MKQSSATGSPVARSTVCGAGWTAALALMLVTAAAARGDQGGNGADGPYQRHIYFNNGVHNDLGCPEPLSCVFERSEDEPSDPWYPTWWISDWKMYRVFQNYENNPPPYASPPAGLSPSDYEVSEGSTYYDSTFVPQDRDGYGAMMEHYEKRCLPIFAFENDYTCSFVSLGNKAYFLTYDDRPEGMPPCCLFSPRNHPPRRDFIRHLPYSKLDSTHLDNSLQAYAKTFSAGDQEILFAYAFYKTPEPDSFDGTAAPYRHPQSFYFSGVPELPSGKPFAPIVSQNYYNFRMERPAPTDTWDRVAQMCSATPPWCCLFRTDCPPAAGQPQDSTPSSNWHAVGGEVLRD